MLHTHTPAASSPEELLFYRMPFHSPLRTLKFEDAVLKNVQNGTVLLLWQNDRTVVIGRNQTAEEEVNLAFAEKEQISVVRRTTGGGAVYHDAGNINFSLFTDLPEDQSFSLKMLAQPVMDALHSLGLPAAFSGRNDLLLDDRKFCGTAARIYENRILFHGCICYDVNLQLMEQVLTPPEEKLLRHGIRSVRSRVTNLAPFFEHIPAESFLQLLQDALLRDHQVVSLSDVIPDLVLLEAKGTAPERIL
ncbi:MAG: lipoate--protein ligase family protein [Lachnospiraceae bacterium]|nr:lipoate--protein ligase family protein [Lachnospiraceae bacterium]